jgi:hypothetical protein
MDLRLIYSSGDPTRVRPYHRAEEPWFACHRVSATDPERFSLTSILESRSRRRGLRDIVADLLIRTAEVLATSDAPGKPI